MLGDDEDDPRRDSSCPGSARGSISGVTSGTGAGIGDTGVSTTVSVGALADVPGEAPVGTPETVPAVGSEAASTTEILPGTEIGSSFVPAPEKTTPVPPEANKEKKKKVLIALPSPNPEKPKIVEPGQSSSGEKLEESDDGESSVSIDRALSPRASPSPFSKKRSSLKGRKVTPVGTHSHHTASGSAKRFSTKTKKPTPAASELSSTRQVPAKPSARKKGVNPVALSPHATSASTAIDFPLRISSHGSCGSMDQRMKFEPSELSESPSPSAIPEPRAKFQIPRKHVSGPGKRQVRVAPHRTSSSRAIPSPSSSRYRMSSRESATSDSYDTALESVSASRLDDLSSGLTKGACRSGRKPPQPMHSRLRHDLRRAKTDLENIPLAPGGALPKNPYALRNPFTHVPVPDAPLEASSEMIIEGLTYSQPVTPRVSSARRASVQEHSSGPSAEVAYAGRVSRMKSDAEGENAAVEHNQRLAKYKEVTTLGKSMRARDTGEMELNLHTEGVVTGDFLPPQNPTSSASGAGDKTLPTPEYQIRRSAMSEASETLQTTPRQPGAPVLPTSSRNSSWSSLLATPPDLEAIAERSPRSVRNPSLLSLGRSAASPPTVNSASGSPAPVINPTTPTKKSPKFASLSGIASLFGVSSIAARSLRNPQAFRPPIPVFEQTTQTTTAQQEQPNSECSATGPIRTEREGQEEQAMQQPAETQDNESDWEDQTHLIGVSGETAAEADENYPLASISKPGLRGGLAPEGDESDLEPTSSFPERPRERLRVVNPDEPIPLRRIGSDLSSMMFSEYYESIRVTESPGRDRSPAGGPPLTDMTNERRAGATFAGPSARNPLSENLNLPPVLGGIRPAFNDLSARSPGSGRTGRMKIRQQKKSVAQGSGSKSARSTVESAPGSISTSASADAQAGLGITSQTPDSSGRSGLSMSDLSMDFMDCPPDPPTTVSSAQGSSPLNKFTYTTHGKRSEEVATSRRRESSEVGRSASSSLFEDVETESPTLQSRIRGRSTSQRRGLELIIPPVPRDYSVEPESPSRAGSTMTPMTDKPSSHDREEEAPVPRTFETGERYEEFPRFESFEGSVPDDNESHEDQSSGAQPIAEEVAKEHRRASSLAHWRMRQHRPAFSEGA